MDLILKKGSKLVVASFLYNTQRANHMCLDVIPFIDVYKEQHGYFKKSSSILESFDLKYFSVKPP